MSMASLVLSASMRAARLPASSLSACVWPMPIPEPFAVASTSKRDRSAKALPLASIAIRPDSGRPVISERIERSSALARNSPSTPGTCPYGSRAMPSAASERPAPLAVVSNVQSRPSCLAFAEKSSASAGAPSNRRDASETRPATWNLPASGTRMPSAFRRISGPSMLLFRSVMTDPAIAASISKVTVPARSASACGTPVSRFVAVPTSAADARLRSAAISPTKSVARLPATGRPESAAKTPRSSASRRPLAAMTGLR